MTLFFCLFTTWFVLNEKPYNIHQTDNSKKLIFHYVCEYSFKYSVDPILILAVMWKESNIKNTQKVNETYDHGIMQINCQPNNELSWCRNIKKLKKIQHNIATGVYIMSLKKKECLRKHGKNNKRHHYIKHYNWYSKTYWPDVLRTKNNMWRLLQKRSFYGTI